MALPFLLLRAGIPQASVVEAADAIDEVDASIIAATGALVGFRSLLAFWASGGVAEAEVVIISADVAETATADDLADASLTTATAVVEVANAADDLDAITIGFCAVDEPADATETLDALVIAAGAAVLAEAANAADQLDAEVISEELPISGGAFIPPLRQFPVVGYGFGILPELEGEAHGIVAVAGTGLGKLPRLGGSAEGSAGVAGRSAAQLVLLRAAAAGDCGQVGRADAILKGFAASSRGVAVVHGAGSGEIVKLQAAAAGQHDDDEAAVMTFLLAA